MIVEDYDITVDWPTAGGNISRTGQSHTGISFPLEIEWTFSECSPILGGIITTGNTLFFTDNKGTLYAIHSDTGKLKWSYALGGPSYGTPAVHENKLYIGNSYAALCFNIENGKIIWQSVANEPVTREKTSNSPICINNYIIFCDQFLTVFDSDSGDVMKTEMISSEPHANTGPGADNENIYIPVLKEIEVFSINELKKIHTIELKNKITSGPVIYKNFIAAGLNDSSIEVISLKDSKESWNYVFNKREYRLVLSRPACAGGMIYAADPFGMIYAFNITTGQLVWEHHYFERIDSPLVISYNKLFVIGNEYIFALSTSDGEFYWERGYDNKTVTYPVTSSPALIKDSLFVGRDKLYAFKKKTG